jgi:4-carboxymuconolactone decarboxylase
MDSIPMVGDDTDDPDLIAVYERIRQAQGSIGNLYRVLANAPAMLGAWIDFAWTLRFAPAADRGLRELAILRIAQLTEAEYEWRAHWKAALGVGLPEEKLLAVSAWRESGVLSDEERLVLEMAEELTTTTTLSGPLMARLRAVFGDQQAVELVLTAAFYSCVSRVVKGLAVPSEPADPSVPALPG